eukprot:4687691-Amphidinium_carterae.1
MQSEGAQSYQEFMVKMWKRCVDLNEMLKQVESDRSHHFNQSATPLEDQKRPEGVWRSGISDL